MMAPSETSVQTTNTRKTDTSHSVGVKVTTKAESTGITDNLELNPWYFRTVPGILKLVQLELATTAVGTVLYFIVAVVQLAATNRKDYHYALYHHGYYSSYIAAGCFGLFNFVAYAAGTFFLFMEWKDSKPATTTVTIPDSTPNPTNSH
ncbi:unnamed protein product [Larinioides sclopetarius]|uniref:MARVEL domain-containing protein n=1 Tax=Larinioides sclopetarius TaxID=280406 RepID=A0AAV2ACT4_9ARAC